MVSEPKVSMAATKIIDTLLDPPPQFENIVAPYSAILSNQSEKQRADLKAHMEKYLGMYLPCSGYEIVQTHRYEQYSNKVEACILATKRWRRGDQMSFCNGTVVVLTDQEESSLGKRDFSLIYSTKYDSTSLFLGKF